LRDLAAAPGQSVYGRLAGYEDVNDADRLALDPVMRQVVGGRAVDAQAVSASQIRRFETGTLAEKPANSPRQGSVAAPPGRELQRRRAQHTHWGKMLDHSANSADILVQRHATWGMCDQTFQESFQPCLMSKKSAVISRSCRGM